MLPKEIGGCKGNNDRFFFNAETKECEVFTYSGCEGNENKFYTEKDCAEACEDFDCETEESPNLPKINCSLPMNRGP
jgi:hypothetical protein